MKKSIIICGFPGIGKSFSCTARDDLHILDLDSSLFTQDPAWKFPEDYIKALDDVIGWEGEPDFILMSTHAETRKELHDKGHEYVLVYPQPELKANYVEAIRKREEEKEYGNPERMVKTIGDNWDTFIAQLEADKNALSHVRLGDGDYLSDVFDYIRKRVTENEV